MTKLTHHESTMRIISKGDKNDKGVAIYGKSGV